MIVELGVSVIFLSNGSVIRRRPLLGGVPRDGSPASSLLLRRSDFPASLLRSLALCSAVPRHDAAKTTGSPRFLGNPPRHAMFSDPGGSVASGHSGEVPYSSTRRCCLPLLLKASAPATSVISRLNRTAYAFAVYASQPPSPTSTQDSLPTGGLPWSGGTRTRWVPS